MVCACVGGSFVAVLVGLLPVVCLYLDLVGVDMVGGFALRSGCVGGLLVSWLVLVLVSCCVLVLDWLGWYLCCMDVGVVTGCV